MVDFSALLRKPAGQAKRPPSLPAGDYPGVIKAFNLDDNNKNKTPYIRFTLGYTGWPDSVDEADREGIDLSKRTIRKDFFMTDDSQWRLDAFLNTSTAFSTEGQTYEEVFPLCIGQPVLISVKQGLNKDNETFNEAGDVIFT